MSMLARLFTNAILVLVSVGALAAGPVPVTVQRLGDLLIDNDTTVNTGIVAHNRCRHVDVTGAHSLIDCDGVGLFDNLSVSTDILSGVIVPAADVNL